MRARWTPEVRRAKGGLTSCAPRRARRRWSVWRSSRETERRRRRVSHLEMRARRRAIAHLQSIQIPALRRSAGEPRDVEVRVVNTQIFYGCKLVTFFVLCPSVIFRDPGIFNGGARPRVLDGGGILVALFSHWLRPNARWRTTRRAQRHAPRCPVSFAPPPPWPAVLTRCPRVP